MINVSDDLKNSLINYKFIDLFSGIGGFRLALESFGAQCVFSSEIDPHAKQIYKDNFGDTPEGDITKIDEKLIPKHNILCAGFPCQSFSISGKQLGFDDARGTLFFDIARIINYHHPEILFLENVKNFERHDEGKTLKKVIEILKLINYDVHYKVLNACFFGIPQKRERIFILAFRKDLNIKKFDFPNPPMLPVKLKDIILQDQDVQDFIIKREDVSFKEKVDFHLDLFQDNLFKPIRIGVVNKGGQGERIYHERGVAITLSAYGGGVGAKTGLHIINGTLRKLAPRECARLMGFPDSFKICSMNGQAYKQFGNSVVVDMLQYILTEIVKQVINNGR